MASPKPMQPVAARGAGGAAGGSGHQQASGAPATAQPASVEKVKSVLVNFIADVSAPLIRASRSQITAALTNKASGGDQCVRHFLTDPQVHVLVVGRELLPGSPAGAEGEGDDVEDQRRYRIFTSLEIDKRATSAASVAVLKRSSAGSLVEGAAGDTAASLAAKVQIAPVGTLTDEEDTVSTAASLSDGERKETTVATAGPLDLISSYLQFVADPVFAAAAAPPAAVEAGPAAEDDVAVRNVAVLRKKLTELLMSVRQVQQSAEVPLVQLKVDPEITQAVEAAKARNEKFSAEKFYSQITAKGDEETAAFLSRLQASVNRWIRDTQKLIRIDRDPATGTLVEEVHFWSGFDRAMQHLDQQIHSTEVEGTLDVLREAKRFMVAASFETDVGYRAQAEAVQSINNVLMKDLPVNDLLTANSVDAITQAIKTIFNHLRKIKNVPAYEPLRSYKLIEVISRDLAAQLKKVLANQRILTLSTEEFDHIHGDCRDLSRAWEEEVKRFKDLVREQQKRKKGNVPILSQLPPAKLVTDHSKILDRIEDIRRVRRQHQRLQTVVRRVLPSTSGGGESAASREIASAFLTFQAVDALDISKSGEENWESAKRLYNVKIDRVETQITNRLRDRLGSARSGVEMFGVFSQFNPLFFRPRIRGAIQEYQTMLLDQLKEDLRAIQVKFNQKYERSADSVIAASLDIPPIGGSIVWARQLERKVEIIMRRGEDVLGKGWEHHEEGQTLRNVGDELLRKLNPQNIFDHWFRGIKDLKGFELNGFLFKVIHHGGNEHNLAMNYDPRTMFLFKEIRFLVGQGYRIPYSVKVTSDDGKWVYPFAVSLAESVRAYTQFCIRLEDPRYSRALPLCAAHQLAVQNTLIEGSRLRWNSEQLESFATTLAAKIGLLEGKIEDAKIQLDELTSLTESLKTVDFSAEGQGVKSVLEGVQQIIKNLALNNFSNMLQFSLDVDNRIEVVLAGRLEDLVNAWAREFEEWPNRGTNLIEAASMHEFRVASHAISLQPPVQAARQYWRYQFHCVLDSICGIPRVGRQAMTYRDLPARLPKNVITSVYALIDKTVEHLQDYVDQWLKYQYLWTVDLSAVVNAVGDDVDAWHDLLAELRSSRLLIDSADERKTFGPIQVDHGHAQQRLLSRLEVWQREILAAFARKLQEQISAFSGQLRRTRQELVAFAGDSKMSFLNDAVVSAGVSEAAQAAAASQVTTFVLQLQRTRNALSGWEKNLKRLIESERLLERQRFSFPSDWIWTDALTSDWEAVQQLVRHQTVLLERYRSQLQAFAMSMARRSQVTLSAIEREWPSARPTRGGTDPGTALQIINKFEGRLTAALEEKATVEAAFKALDLTLPAAAPSSDGATAITPEALQDELASLKSVWIELRSLYAALDNLRETPWTAVQPKKVRAALADLAAQVKAIPPRFRQYEAFEHLHEMVNSYLKVNSLLADMRTDALKERHWKRMLDLLDLSNENVADLTLGSFWNARVNEHEEQIREILFETQGELALEEFLHTLRATWSNYDLDLVLYKNRCKLVRGWDELFGLLDDHLASLQSMKLSPYFKFFEEEANAWDEKLSRLRELLDTWMEVQRRWVYLEGVFTSSADIQSLLPREYTKFKQVDNEFLSIMKRTAGKPKVLDALAADGLQRSLERLLDSLAKIQKALGEYLERQRQEFPRFYFVGDEDLLEMIGNSKDAKIVQRHLGKMFAGIAHLVIRSEDDGHTVEGVSSKEGEIVHFRNAINLDKFSGLNAWLKEVEQQMTLTLAALLFSLINELSHANANFFEIVARYPTQMVLVAVQILWTRDVESAMKSNRLPAAEKARKTFLDELAEHVLHETDRMMNTKLVQLITEIVHQRGVIRDLVNEGVSDAGDFRWARHMRYYYDSETPADAATADLRDRFVIQMADATFVYKFEYLGIAEKLVQTELTDNAYLTLTQALHLRLGGNPFGPAGTGKTETVKALGAQLGRFVLVFCCDETFDFNAMGRIFVGLCQVGAWGCFDEFNRLEERMLSACSEQILMIQTGLRGHKKIISLLNKEVQLQQDMGIFVTMNPGYAGRSNLPDNLKQLFREIAMISPDKVQIVQVLLYAQGFQSAELLSSKVVALFDLCLQQLSAQPHYDFGLRSLKNVLGCAGNMKRVSGGDDDAEAEQRILLKSICDTMVPKLVAADVPLLRALLQGVFPGADLLPVDEASLEAEIRGLCQQRYYEPRTEWVAKVLQLYQIQRLSHGVMVVGPVGVGKSVAWRTLLDAMGRVDGVRGQSYVLNAKSVTKDLLYGKLDSTTLEWADGVFTALLRKILAQNEDMGKRHWIVFDGDVDPEWAENLNSVLDDNKLLTLPNGERLPIPPNVRILFEVDSLKHATLATVSRCGMVWFSDDVMPPYCIASHFLNTMKYGDAGEDAGAAAAAAVGPSRAGTRHRLDLNGAEFAVSGSMALDNPLRSLQSGVLSRKETAAAGMPSSVLPTGAVSFEEDGTGGVVAGGPPPPSIIFTSPAGGVNSSSGRSAAEKRVCAVAYDILAPYFEQNELACRVLELAGTFPHIMQFTVMRVLESTFSLIRQAIAQCVDHDDLHSDAPLTTDALDKYLTKSLLFAFCWGCGGGMQLSTREQFCREVARLASEMSGIALPKDLDEETTLLDFEVRFPEGTWHHWRERVVSVEVNQGQVQDANVVIETIDTIRHRRVLSCWLEEKKPFILCGPPGSGKTMTLTSTLKGLSEFDIASLNFSSGTTPEVLLKTFDHYCEYAKTNSGTVLRPATPGRWLIVFADEINLPEPDRYGTQRVIMFIRQLQEYAGFWRLADQASGQWTWVRLERIQFAGACNPPTDAGRHPLSDRFLRHAPLLFVDFPGTESLKQIYGTFSRALLQPIANLRGQAAALTDAMVHFYTASQERFTVDLQPHYVYSPRELTRWKLALWEALRNRDYMELRELVRLFSHEAQRIFQDRLVEQSERDWTDETLNEVIRTHFNMSDPETLQRPILFSTILDPENDAYVEVPRDRLREAIHAKLRVYNEEELNVQLVLFDQVLDHITRIDRVLRQPLGHLLLVGASGAGKTVLSKFVSWMNGLSVFQIKAGRNYDTAAFEADLRTVMKRAGLRGERVTFIFDESNALGPAFLERMNALLASGEVPGLFEGDELALLLNEARQAFAESGTITSDDSELFVRFTRQVQRNLHIVFTMNPANPDFSNRQATSPALFNRCVIDWFGDWSHGALSQVAREFTDALEVGPRCFSIPTEESDRRERLSGTIVAMHEAVSAADLRLQRSGKKYNYLTPRDFLDFIRHFTMLVGEKRAENAESYRHLTAGLAKLRETALQVVELQASLSVKEVELGEKNRQAEEKMQLMVSQQTVAEQRKKEAEQLATELDAKSVTITERREGVELELKEVEPLLREAQNAVSNIPKKYLDELRSMGNPPAAVKFAVEATVIMLQNAGTTPMTWEEARKGLKSNDFISRVVQFDASSMSALTVQRVTRSYIENASWDKEKIERASKAAGPLAQWAESSLRYQSIVQKVDPLRKEIAELEREFADNEKRLNDTQGEIGTLEKRLQAYKAEYAQLIADVQTIKHEMSVVKTKVERSSALLKNLTTEKDRWSAASETSNEQIETVLGDCLVAAGFCTYLGFFDSNDRAAIMLDWDTLLREASIKMLDDLSLIEYLSKPGDRYQWQSNALHSDNLSTENAIIINRYIRYPLIIDPSGQATTFLANQYADRKIVKTSFLDPSFFKTLESALRFGTPLLVQDVERVDPILNSVLNQETHKAGGRTLITVGDADIDFSPAFTMFLTTRDSTAAFTPDLCSRVTFVNFTLTPSSLQNQCLNAVLKAERPDVEKKRQDALKLQGEFRLRIRELEESLLHSLSKISGNILDDDTVMTTLESLKTRVAEVQRQAASADRVMADVEKAISTYISLARAAARVFFTLQNMHYLSPLYQYDLSFFNSVFDDTLKEEIQGTESEARLSALFARFFANVYFRVAVGTLQKDRLVVSLELACIWLESATGVAVAPAELELLLQGGAGQSSSPTGAAGVGAPSAASPGAENAERLQAVLGAADRVRSLLQLKKLPFFSDIDNAILADPDAWRTAIEDGSAMPELRIAKLSGGGAEGGDNAESGDAAETLSLSPVAALRTALLTRALRPDRLSAALAFFVGSAALVNHAAAPAAAQGGGSAAKSLTAVPEVTAYELHTITRNVLTARVPIIFISSPGFDPSAKIMEASNLGGRTTGVASIAMGSEEGYKQADQAILSAARQGSWVLCKNVHFCHTNWLQDLEKRLFKLGSTGGNLHVNFRLFLTMEFSTKVPANLLRAAFTIITEAPSGLKASMQRTYLQGLPSVRRPVVARNRVHFLLAFLHAVILERKRYVPFGWSKGYEFSDADQLCAFQIVDRWIDSSSGGGGGSGAGDTTNQRKLPREAPVPRESDLVEKLPASQLPLAALRTLLVETVYGGRLDNDVDRRALRSFVEHLFRPEAFANNFHLAEGYSGPDSEPIPALVAPEPEASETGYMNYIEGMRGVDEPAWLALAPRADRLLSVRQAMETLERWLLLRSKASDDLRDLVPSLTAAAAGSRALVSSQRFSLGRPSTLAVGGAAGGWLQTDLRPRVAALLSLLVAPLRPLPRSEDALVNPLFRSLEREVRTVAACVDQVERNLQELLEVCNGNTKLTNELRDIARNVTGGTVPEVWSRGRKAGVRRTLIDWLTDMCYRAAQLADIAETFHSAKTGAPSIFFATTPEREAATRQYAERVKMACFGPQFQGKLSPNKLWFGGLVYPAAFLTATRQAVAHRLNRSLDDLELTYDIGALAEERTDILAGGTSLENASFDGKTLVLSNSLAESLPPIRLRWLPKDEANRINGSDRAEIPVFLTNDRTELVAMSRQAAVPPASNHAWNHRGVAIILWTPIL